MTQGFGGFFLILGASCGYGAGFMAGAGPEFRCVLCPFLSAYHDANQNI